ncbi:MAG TPA: DNRLRE domain-containing protein [Ignavibacteria bacterium]|nr:DNRLRE domain-containing protein [Ignavibacteria bacterium]HRK00183.1 DNRLRE domain-containing protein [Ignavibacteria bacterium]
MSKINEQFKFLLTANFILALFIFSASNVVSQTTVNITLCNDNTLYEDPTGETSNGSGQYFFTGTTVSEQIRRGLIKFYVKKDIPQCAVITNVSLRLHMSRTISGDKNVELRNVEKDWGASFSDAPGEEGFGTQAESGDATWLHTFYNTETWTNPGGDFSANPSAVIPVGGVGFYTWNSPQMIQDVQSWLNDPQTNYGWMLYGTEDEAATAKRFDSRENDSVSFRPVLTVTYIVNDISLYTASLIEGFFDGIEMVPDTLKITLRNQNSPYAPVDSEKGLSNNLGDLNNCFSAPTGMYYIVVNHRNSIETWSKFPVLLTQNYGDYYNFTDAANKAYGDNQVLKLGSYCIYSGDVDQDGLVDITDGGLVDNDASVFATGYIPTDVNGDDLADLADASIVDNNANNFVSKMTP